MIAHEQKVVKTRKTTKTMKTPKYTKNRSKISSKSWKLTEIDRNLRNLPKNRHFGKNGAPKVLINQV